MTFIIYIYIYIYTKALKHVKTLIGGSPNGIFVPCPGWALAWAQEGSVVGAPPPPSPPPPSSASFGDWVFPQSVTHVGDWVFPQSVTHVGDWVFTQSVCFKHTEFDS